MPQTQNHLLKIWIRRLWAAFEILSSTRKSSSFGLVSLIWTKAFYSILYGTYFWIVLVGKNLPISVYTSNQYTDIICLNLKFILLKYNWLINLLYLIT